LPSDMNGKSPGQTAQILNSIKTHANGFVLMKYRSLASKDSWFSLG